MTKKIDIHELLKQRKQIAIIWGIEDVQDMRPDLEDQQAYEVLQSCKDNHDASYGMSREDIWIHAESMFPEKNRKGQDT